MSTRPQGSPVHGVLWHRKGPRLNLRPGRGLSKAVAKLARLLALATGLLLEPPASAASPTASELAAAQAWSEANLGGASQMPFSFVYGDQAAASLLPAWRFTRVIRTNAPVGPGPDQLPGVQAQESTWTDPLTGLEVRCTSVAYAAFPTVEWTLEFRNGGTNDTPLLSGIQAVDLSLPRPAQGEFVLHHHAGDRCTADSYEPRRSPLPPGADLRFAPEGGRPTSGAFPYFNVEWPGAGLIVVIGWPGQWAAQFTRDTERGLRIRGGQELTRFTLRPGEQVRSPRVVLQFWQEDRVRAQNVWRRWMLAHNTPHDRDGRPPRPLLSSCSGGFFPGLKTSEAGEREFITAFQHAGVRLDYWWIDAGWYTCADWPQTGTWTPDPTRYPQGFKPISDLVHAQGAGLIVWFEPERVTPGSFLDTQDPAWVLGRNGGQKLLNLGHPPARQWLTDHVDRMLTAEGIDFYRQDFNLDPLPYWRDHDAADRQGITEIRHVEGYLAYWDELRRRHPGLRIDSCASGGRRNDIETLRRAVPLLRSDYQAFDGNPSFAPGNQGHTFGLSSWIPYYGQGVYFSERDFVYSVRSYLSPAFGICADVRKPGIDWALIRRFAEQWREVADCFLGDFYPLTPHQLNEEVWIAWQFDLPERGRGMIQAFRRARSIYESARFTLQGLDPAARYRVVDLDEPSTPRVFGGRELRERGLLIEAAGQPAASLLTYERLQPAP